MRSDHRRSCRHTKSAAAHAGTRVLYAAIRDTYAEVITLFAWYAKTCIFINGTTWRAALQLQCARRAGAPDASAHHCFSTLQITLYLLGVLVIVLLVVRVEAIGTVLPVC